MPLKGGVVHEATGVDGVGRAVERNGWLDVGGGRHLPRVRHSLSCESAPTGVPVSVVSGDGVSSKKTEKEFARIVTNEQGVLCCQFDTFQKRGDTVISQEKPRLLLLLGAGASYGRVPNTPQLTDIIRQHLAGDPSSAPLVKWLAEQSVGKNANFEDWIDLMDLGYGASDSGMVYRDQV